MLELIIVIAIVGIVASFAFPAYKSWIQHGAVNNSIAMLMANLKQARNMAVAESRSVVVSFDDATVSMTYDADTTGACSYCKNQKLSFLKFSPHITMIRSRQADLKFKSDGSTNGQTTRIKLKIDSYYKCITVNVIGRAYEDDSNKCARL